MRTHATAYISSHLTLHMNNVTLGRMQTLSELVSMYFIAPTRFVLLILSDMETIIYFIFKTLHLQILELISCLNNINNTHEDSFMEMKKL